ncbi:MAG TPA: glycosyltransferase family 2 protein [Candidatus Baltobacteraceae bacterium]|nr:glycosyltransferase family 2 protein [Candidatus Baltobacteraceae bacterium]
MVRKNVAVFIPMHNERETIGGVIERVLDAAGDRLGLLVVADDASADGSGKIAAGYTDHVVRLPQNGGNGSATRAALRHVLSNDRGIEHVIRIDGDGQHDPALLGDVIASLDSGADVVVCSRFHPRSDMSHVPLDRRFLNASAALWMRTVTRWLVTDARSGFLGFRWSLLRPVVPALRTERYGIPMELLLRVWRQDPSARYVEIPHPAMYQPGISDRLDRKYREETVLEQAARMDEAYKVFVATCRDLGIL